jgi:hypothetical protein
MNGNTAATIVICFLFGCAVTLIIAGHSGWALLFIFTAFFVKVKE